MNMREIKFRGKRIYNGEWLYGDLIHNNEQVLIHPQLNEPFEYPEDYDENVDPKTVGQYTGLKDKNGVEIYESDILQVPDLYETPENTSTTYHNEVIVFQDCAFCLGEGNPIYEDHEYISDECEVIGNIYANPDLLPKAIVANE